MTDIPESQYIACTLSPEHIEALSVLINKEKSEFRDISIITDPNTVMLFSIEPEVIPEDSIWAVLEIPYSTNMCNFYTEFSKALREEYTITGCGEKKG